MCGRFTLTTDIEDIMNEFSIDESINVDYKPRYNIAPSQKILGITEKNGKRILGEYRWGLVPFWAKDIKIGFSMINARAETLQTKPAYRNLIAHKRLIIPSDGFYEWKKIGSDKQPYRFQIESKKVYGFAGLYDQWKSPTGDIIQSCTIITTTPNTLVKDVHDRMPVILTKENLNIWIDEGTSDKDLLMNLLTPFPADKMISYPVSKSVGNVKNVNPELIDEIPLNSK